MKLYAFTLSFLLLLVSCGDNLSDPPKNDATPDISTENPISSKGEVSIIEPAIDEAIVVLKKDGIMLTEIKTAQHNEASLTLNTQQFTVGKNHLNFEAEGVSNYSIAYLANNYALSHFSSAVFNVELLYGNNVFLAFLTDKNNISIKTNKGSVLKNAVLGNEKSLFDTKAPHLFYHLPQAETTMPILDFYLVNTAISEQGNKVKVTINQTTFILEKWAAYQIQGLSRAENTVRIQLIDKNNAIVEGPFNDSGDRRFNFKKSH